MWTVDNVRLTGDRVYLRPIQRGDALTLAEASHLEDETGLHEDGRVPMSILSFESWISGLADNERVFAVCRHGDDTCIGTVSIRNIDWKNGTAETGSGLLNSADRGQGIGTEAKRLALEHAFGSLGLHALSSTVYEGNLRSARALEKQGYRLAGRLTANIRGAGGVFGDTLVFDITRDDWERAKG
jgi:RimJ/RimL family protein N-acetyltransferase